MARWWWKPNFIRDLEFSFLFSFFLLQNNLRKTKRKKNLQKSLLRRWGQDFLLNFVLFLFVVNFSYYNITGAESLTTLVDVTYIRRRWSNICFNRNATMTITVAQFRTAKIEGKILVELTRARAYGMQIEGNWNATVSNLPFQLFFLTC